MGGRQAHSHTKAPFLSKGSGWLTVSGPWAEVETEAEVLRSGFHERWSCMGVSNERPGWMRSVRGVSSFPTAWPSSQRLVNHRGYLKSFRSASEEAQAFQRIEQSIHWHAVGMGWGEMGHRWGVVTWDCGGSFLNRAPKNKIFHYLGIQSKKRMKGFSS